MLAGSNPHKGQDDAMSASARNQPGIPMAPGLSDREALVLRHVIHNFILSANPVGSRTVSKLRGIDMSAATIRNAMADLEEKGLLAHPHTSAGRVPTDYGYRVYVNHLMHLEQLSVEEKQLIESNVDELMPDVEAILGRTARLLSSISRQLGVVLSPSFEEGRLERIELVPLARNRMLVVISVASGLAHTVTLEIERELRPEDIPAVRILLQKRLAGLSLREIRETIRERFADIGGELGGLVRLFINSTDRLFRLPAEQALIVEGARNIPDIPEFREEGLRSVLEILEDREMVLHLLGRHIHDELRVSIGSEHADERAVDYGLVTAGFVVGSLPGALGIIGPRRMPYSRLVSLVRYTADLINRRFRDEDGDTSQQTDTAS
jgi:heat-inducible transcriptional repressor